MAALFFVRGNRISSPTKTRFRVMAAAGRPKARIFLERQFALMFSELRVGAMRAAPHLIGEAAATPWVGASLFIDGDRRRLAFPKIPLSE